MTTSPTDDTMNGLHDLPPIFAWRCQECRRLQPSIAMPTAIVIREAVVDLDADQPSFRNRTIAVCRDCLAHIKEREQHGT